MAGQNAVSRSRSGRDHDQGQGQPGVPDVEYDLISLIYHNLEGVEASGRYASDAVEAGEDELAQLFRDAQQSYLQQADRARQLLRQRIGGAR
jgi:hypothetical protein